MNVTANKPVAAPATLVATGTIQTQEVKMFANFSKAIFLPLTGELADIKKSADLIYEKMKAAGAGLSKHTVHALLEGKEKLVRGFEVVSIADHHVVAMAAKRPEGVSDKVWGGYQPAGPIQAVRKGSKIGLGLEALKDGCSLAQLKDALGHDGEDTTAFLTRPKKRGYGIRFDAETKEYFLVMPEGVSEIAYK